ncbi:hypothetical protein [Nocardioides lentus]
MNVHTLPTGQLLQQYRELCLRLDPADAAQVRAVDVREEEILGRMAW